MRKTEEIPQKNQKLGRNWRNIDSVSFRQLPPASAASCLRRFRYCWIFIQLAALVIFWAEDERWEILRKNGRNSPKMSETRAELAKYCFRQLPSASASFRSQLFAVVSLLVGLYPVGGVVNFFGRKMSDRKY